MWVDYRVGSDEWDLVEDVSGGSGGTLYASEAVTRTYVIVDSVVILWSNAVDCVCARILSSTVH